MLLPVEGDQAAGGVGPPEEVGDGVHLPVAFPQPIRMLVVVVDADHVGGDALPAVVADDGPRRVDRLGQVVERRDVVALGRVARQVGTPHDSLKGPG
jgi:hypothetical protein